MSLMNLNSNRQFVFGRLATALYFISLIGLGWIGFSYSLFPEYTVPVLLVLVFGLAGLMFAFTSGGLRIQIAPLQATVIFTGFLGIFVVLGLNIFTSYFTNLVTPITQSSAVLSMPLVVSIAFFAFVGVQEEAMWSGIYIFLKRLFAQSTLLIIGIVALGGMAFHQAVAKQLFSGTIFNSPEFFLWIGFSWVFYRLVLELTGNIGTTMLTHFTWNVGVTLINQGVFA
jgi:membrane protease YdiL (CAAX protease family)